MNNEISTDSETRIHEIPEISSSKSPPTPAFHHEFEIYIENYFAVDIQQRCYAKCYQRSLIFLVVLFWLLLSHKPRLVTHADQAP